MPHTEESLRNELARHQGWLETLPGFAGSGVGLDPGGGVSIVVYTNNMPAPTREAVHARFQGWPLHLEEMGSVRAFPASDS